LHSHSSDDHHHADEVRHGSEHTHGVVDPSIITTERGIWAVKWSFIGLMITALFQVVIVALSSSVALFADTIHNFGDASTAIPLWIAFRIARMKPTKRFTYGLGRVEDLAGIVIVLTILASAIIAGYESVNRFFNPEPVSHLWAVALASIIGFFGNELVAIFRIRVGKEIHSAALIADGYHARVDGITSLGVLAGAIAVWLGFPLGDPIAGIIITVMILRIVWQSSKEVFMRMLDGVDPEVIDEIEHAVMHVSDIEELSEVRVRWIGHRLHAEVNIAVHPKFSVTEAHNLGSEARHQIMHHLPYLSNVIVHVDPIDESGETFHRIENHTHDQHQPHFHP
jgi:cation diffusion facilitator family transporter